MLTLVSAHWDPDLEYRARCAYGHGYGGYAVGGGYSGAALSGLAAGYVQPAVKVAAAAPAVASYNLGNFIFFIINSLVNK